MVCCALSDKTRTIREANDGGIIRIQLNQGADTNSVKYFPFPFLKKTIDSSREEKLHEHTTNTRHNHLEGYAETRLLSLRLAPLCLFQGFQS